MENHQDIIKPMDINQITPNITIIRTELNLLRWRLSQIYNLRNTVSVEVLKHINGMYAIFKNLQLITQPLKLINNFNFIQFIHQSIIFDYIYDEMNRTRNECPEFYKREAIKRTTTTVLKDIISASILEAGYVLQMDELNEYIDLFMLNPPMHSSYRKDKKKLYQNIKMKFPLYFILQQEPSTNYYY